MQTKIVIVITILSLIAASFIIAFSIVMSQKPKRFADHVIKNWIDDDSQLFSGKRAENLLLSSLVAEQIHEKWTPICLGPNRLHPCKTKEGYYLFDQKTSQYVKYTMNQTKEIPIEIDGHIDIRRLQVIRGGFVGYKKNKSCFIIFDHDMKELKRVSKHPFYEEVKLEDRIIKAVADYDGGQVFVSVDGENNYILGFIRDGRVENESCILDNLKFKSIEINQVLPDTREVLVTIQNRICGKIKV